MMLAEIWKCNEPDVDFECDKEIGMKMNQMKNDNASIEGMGIAILVAYVICTALVCWTAITIVGMILAHLG
jgi:hypothetical protein